MAIKMTKKEIKEITNREVPTTIEFIKSDGTKRKMICSTNWDFLAKKKIKLNDGGVRDKPKKEPDHLIIVWDLEKNGFRYITITKILNIY